SCHEEIVVRCQNQSFRRLAPLRPILNLSFRRVAQATKEESAVLATANVVLALPLQLNNLTASREQHHTRHPDEESMLDNAGHLAQLSSQAIRITNRPEPAIQDVIVFVGNIGSAIRILPQTYLRSQRLDPLRHQCLCKANDLHRERKLS